MTVSSSPACSEAGAQGPRIGVDACWQAWFDGAALPNPGKIGVGVVLLSPAGARAEKSMLLTCSGCSNEAELHALCIALDMAREAGAARLVLRGDSDVAIRYVRGPDATQIERLRILVARAREGLERFEEVQLLWIPRHRNVDADRLSRQALGLKQIPAGAGKGRRRSR